MSHEFSDSPVSIEISFDPEKYKTDPTKCVNYNFHFKDSTEIKSMEEVDIKIINTLRLCADSVGRVLENYSALYREYNEKVDNEIKRLTDKGLEG